MKHIHLPKGWYRPSVIRKQIKLHKRNKQDAFHDDLDFEMDYLHASFDGNGHHVKTKSDPFTKRHVKGDPYREKEQLVHTDTSHSVRYSVHMKDITDTVSNGAEVVQKGAKAYAECKGVPTSGSFLTDSKFKNTCKQFFNSLDKVWPDIKQISLRLGDRRHLHYKEKVMKDLTTNNQYNLANLCQEKGVPRLADGLKQLKKYKALRAKDPKTYSSKVERQKRRVKNYTADAKRWAGADNQEELHIVQHDHLANTDRTHSLRKRHYPYSVQESLLNEMANWMDGHKKDYKALSPRDKKACMNRLKHFASDVQKYTRYINFHSPKMHHLDTRYSHGMDSNEDSLTVQQARGKALKHDLTSLSASEKSKNPSGKGNSGGNNRHTSKSRKYRKPNKHQNNGSVNRKFKSHPQKDESDSYNLLTVGNDIDVHMGVNVAMRGLNQISFRDLHKSMENFGQMTKFLHNGNLTDYYKHIYKDISPHRIRPIVKPITEGLMKSSLGTALKDYGVHIPKADRMNSLAKNSLKIAKRGITDGEKVKKATKPILKNLNHFEKVLAKDGNKSQNAKKYLKGHKKLSRQHLNKDISKMNKRNKSHAKERLSRNIHRGHDLSR